MENKSTEQIEQNGLKKVTVRFSKDALSVIDNLAEVNGRTRSEIIRLVIDNRLTSYLSKVTFVEHEDAVEYQKKLADLLTTMEDIRNELHRIGVNYNQELKLKQIEKKYAKTKMTYDAITMKKREEESVMNDVSNLNKEQLDALMKRYENATKKVGEVLCRTLE